MESVPSTSLRDAEYGSTDLAPSENKVIIDESLTDFGDLPPAVTPSKIDMPAVTEDLRPREARVKLEDLGDVDDEVGAASTTVDTDSYVVEVDTDDAFAPEPAEPDIKVPTIRGLEVVELGPGLKVETPAASEAIPEPIAPADAEPILLVPHDPVPAEEIASRLEAEPGRVEQLLEALLGEDTGLAQQAKDELLSIGDECLVEVMNAYPGRLTFDIHGAHDSIPPLAEHGALLDLLVSMGPVICDSVAERLDDPGALERYYAVVLLGEVPCERAVAHLASRLYDRDAKVRLGAIDVLQKYRNTQAFDVILKGLRSRLASENADQIAIAAALLGNFKDLDALPALVGLVRSRHKMVARAAVESLSYITKQDFGSSERKWLKWWKQHKGESRVKWLIVGLRSKNRDVRFSSAQELSDQTDEFFGYYFDSSRADREKAVRRWELWWEETGRFLNGG